MTHYATARGSAPGLNGSAEALAALVDRIEKAMRPLHNTRYGPDHDRVRHLYLNLVRTSTGDPLQHARRTVLYEILYPVLYSNIVT